MPNGDGDGMGSDGEDRETYYGGHHGGRGWDHGKGNDGKLAFGINLFLFSKIGHMIVNR